MANVASSIDYVLHQEDANLSGFVTKDKRDAGGLTRFGISQRFHPELTGLGFFDETKTSAVQALKIAVSVYQTEYAANLRIAAINTQQVANAILSFAVNEGVIPSIKVLQDALHLTVDGVFGPVTLDAVNSTSNILELLEPKQSEHYKAIVIAHPEDAVWLKGWMNRIKRNCECEVSA